MHSLRLCRHPWQNGCSVVRDSSCLVQNTEDIGLVRKKPIIDQNRRVSGAIEPGIIICRFPMDFGFSNVCWIHTSIRDTERIGEPETSMRDIKPAGRGSLPLARCLYADRVGSLGKLRPDSWDHDSVPVLGEGHPSCSGCVRQRLQPGGIGKVVLDVIGNDEPAKLIGVRQFRIGQLGKFSGVVGTLSLVDLLSK